ncbi:MAG: hypothetical protein Q8O03_00710 [Nanoarchaeota archaeon]|nr:hypothetical protein [Nanoarchaeota archaeon]
MVSVIEKVENDKEFVEICKRYNIICIPQPTIIFSRVAEILYKKNEDAKYAICDSDARIELVRYEDKTELINYCKKKKFDTIAFVYKDGSGKMGSLEEMLKEEK